MGNSRSTSMGGTGTDNSGGQLFVALKLHKPDGQPMSLDAVPHVTGSMPIVGFWDPAKAVSFSYWSSWALYSHLSSSDGWQLVSALYNGSLHYPLVFLVAFTGTDADVLVTLMFLLNLILVNHHSCFHVSKRDVHYHEGFRLCWCKSATHGILINFSGSWKRGTSISYANGSSAEHLFQIVELVALEKKCRWGLNFESKWW